MKTNILNIKYKRLACVPWLFLALIVFLLSTAIAFTVIPHSLAAQVTMEVYQQEGRKAFGKNTSLDIFNDPKLEGEKLVHPFSNGSYTFAVYNNSDSAPLPYSLKITGINPDEIPLVFSLQKNGAYVFGGEEITNMLPISEKDFDQTLLDGKKTDLYTIKWQWKTESDYIDTSIGNDGTQLYQLIITATGTIPETDEFSPKTKDDPKNSPPGTGGNSNNFLPKTGDDSNLFLWGSIMSVGLALLLILIFRKRKVR